jgi:transcriptional regulator with XRE-family HTH domain
MKFGEKLRDLRKKNGLTQAELAEKEKSIQPSLIYWM